MWNTRLSLIRYLFVLDVTASLVYLPRWPAIELTHLLREIIADQLPMTQARPWKKRINAAPFPGLGSNGYPHTLVDRPWPVDAVIHWYPAKRTYGRGEKILFELKLFGPGADHGFFLEVILPAIESLSRTTEHYSLGGNSTNGLWGHFDIPSVYSARGLHWKPVIANGKLDLRYKVNPTQWSSGIKFDAIPASPNLKCLTWVTPFSLESGNPQLKGGKKHKTGPDLRQLLEATRQRIDAVAGGESPFHQANIDAADDNGESRWESALSQAAKNRVVEGRFEQYSFTPRTKFLGFQRFDNNIPKEIIPYLQLASVFHIGEDTHYGFGGFTVG